jgi:hypothetical protein
VGEPGRTDTRSGELGAAILLTATVGALLAWLAFDNGSYSPLTWGAAAVAVWWAVALAAVGVLPIARPAGPARLVAAALAGLVVLSVLSAFWAADASRAYADAARIALYLGAFVLVSLLARRDTLGSWLDGLELGVVAIALIALASRLFPSLGLGHAGGSILPTVVTRLSYPLGYWNGLAIFAGLAVPLLLRTAISARALAIRLLAVAAVPALAGVVYLASSRGGAIVAALGAVAFIASSGRAWAAAGASLAGVVGSAVIVLALHSRHTLVDGPVTSAVARSEGRSAAVSLILAGLVAALVWLAIEQLGRRLNPSRATRLVVVALLAVAAVVVIVASHPAARFDAFKQPPLRPNASGFTAAHLLSESGSGRWQFWSSAVDEWRTARLAGKGAGSFAAWWAQHGTVALTAQDAHSVFFQTLGELGLLGFVLVAAVLILGPALGFARFGGLAGQDRLAAAAAASTAAAFAVGAAIDWMWQLPAVALAGVTALALATAPGGGRPYRVRGGARALVAVPLVLIAFELVPLTGGLALDRSTNAARRGDVPAAVTAALRAHAVEPWALAPVVQLALLEESRGRLAAAQTWIDRAREIDDGDWQTRLIAARIETKRGAVEDAKADLAAARRLNPRSPLFSGSG